LAFLLSVVRQVADRLGVPDVSTDWRETIERLRPDIVAIATPAALRGPVVEAAVAVGVHVLCEKPLAVTGEEAGRLYGLVKDAGIKHAYAATHRYGPSTQWLAELVRDSAIGTLDEIVSTVRTGPVSILPWSWASRVADGGGLLNNGLPHALGILSDIAGGELLRVTGTARGHLDHAPVVSDLHDFREGRHLRLTPEEAARYAQRPVDADDAFTAIMEFATPNGRVTATSVVGPGLPVADEAAGFRLYGSGRTLIARGVLDYDVSRIRAFGEAPEPLPVPQRLLDELPNVGDNVQNKWCALARDFVADIRGEAFRPYLTFRDGWRYQVAVDTIRSGQGWRDLPGSDERRHVQVLARRTPAGRVGMDQPRSASEWRHGEARYRASASAVSRKGRPTSPAPS